MEDVEGGLKSVATALDLLNCFVEDESLGVSQAARKLGVAKSTAHRLLTTLASRGLVEQEPGTGRYRLGVHLFELGHLALERLELRRQSRTLLEELREVSGWTVHLGIAQGPDVLFLERLPTLRGMSAMTEYRRRWPLHTTSSGKVIAAYDPVAARERIDAGFPLYTATTIGDEKAWNKELAEIRKRGYATSVSEVMDRLASVAAPVLDSHGFARASISIQGSSDELRDKMDRQVRLVTAAAQRLGKMLQKSARAEE